MAIAAVSITPIGEGVSVSRFVAATQEVLCGQERLRYHYAAIDRVPSGVPINVLLYPMEGDYFASIAYWLLAYQTGGAFMSISKDWP